LQKLRDDEDWDGLAKYPAPRPNLFLTQPHLQQQAALDLANFSPHLTVYIYGGNSEKERSTIGPVRRIRNELTRSSGIFNEKEELNANTIVVCSYQTFSQRHGPKANETALEKRFPGMSTEELKTARFDEATVTDPRTGETTPASHNLEGLFGIVFADESHVTKGQFPRRNAPLY
jgi:hypothetical protein